VSEFNPYEPPNSGSQAFGEPEPALQDSGEPVEIFVADSPVQAGAIVALLEQSEIPVSSHALGLDSAFAMGTTPDQRHSIWVSRQSVTRAQQLIQEFEDAEPEFVYDEEQTFEERADSPEAEPDDDELDMERRRRQRNAWVFLFPFFLPFSAMISLTNASRANELNLKLGRSTSFAMVVVQGLAWLEIAAFVGLSLVLINALIS